MEEEDDLNDDRDDDDDGDCDDEDDGDCDDDDECDKDESESALFLLCGGGNTDIYVGVNNLFIYIV
jgi:hypothetical protein